MIRRHPILRRMRPHHPDRPLRILQLHRIVILRPQPYFSTNAATPRSFNHSSNRIPFLLHRQMRYPPPGATTTPVFVAFGPTGKNTVSEGLSTSSSPKAPGAPAGHNNIVFPAPPCDTAEAVDGGGAGVTCPNPIPPTIIANIKSKNNLSSPRLLVHTKTSNASNDLQFPLNICFDITPHIPYPCISSQAPENQ